MAELASKNYVKRKTRQEHGTCNFQNTTVVNVTFKSPFNYIPHVIVSKGDVEDATVTGFIIELDTAYTGKIVWQAIPQDHDPDYEEAD